ncbi:MAG: M15 family metallopeptidase [Agarilytica sp.]
MDELRKNINKYSELLKQVNVFIEFNAFDKPIHKNICKDFAAMKQSAAEEGFDLKIASGYRSVAHQIVIWNEKSQGVRPVLDGEENPVDIKKIKTKDLVFAILRWSALPGASRHHWGSDFDVYDASAIGDDYRLQLNVRETEKDGPFYPFYLWLNDYLQQKSCAFYRPYNIDCGGVAREPWHLSHKATAGPFEALLNFEAFRSCVESLDIALKKEVLENLDEIFTRFVSIH